MSLRIRETNIFEESYRDITLIKSKNERITSEPTAKIKKDKLLCSMRADSYDIRVYLNLLQKC